MRSMIGYGVVVFALCLLSVLDFQRSEAGEVFDRGAYYSQARLGGAGPEIKSKSKPKAEVREYLSTGQLAAWPERVLKVNKKSFLLAKAYAVRVEDFVEPMGEMIAKRQDYVIFVPSRESRFDGFFINENRFPVVINEVNGELGIITGNVKIKLKSPEVAGLVSSAVKSQILNVNDSESTATLKLPFEQDLTSVIHVIRNYAGVESAELQVVTRKKR